MLKEMMLEKKIWAVVGANRNPEKFGNKILKRLKERGYEVYAVNPLYDTIDGELCYKNLSSLPVLPDVVDMVVSPERGKPVIEEAARLGIKYMWFQPGTHDEETIEMAENLGLKTVQACVLVATNQK